ncbi:hypothetical protein SAY87_026874 [Trapa incisa]|uniref:RING-type E3 ubiquitin transferase n=1 Tax=Trapa incisa TaxID=236973 RepID=A0AAN7JM55_9MYRT|nr:hypothetical protein SAY87_026874 [Trapa incisa]
MEISSLKALAESISIYFQLSSHLSINSEPALKYYKQGEEMLKLVKLVLDAIFGSEVACDEVLNKAFEELLHSIKDLIDSFESWQPLLSKVYFVNHNEQLLSQIQSSGLYIFQLLMSSNKPLPDELSPVSIEHCEEKLKHVAPDHSSSLIKEAVQDQLEGVEPSPEILAKVAVSLSLKSNQEILIEAVALEKLKEKAEQAEKPDEVEDIDQLITLVTCVHECLIMIKQSQSSSPVPIPADFCCPLSLELMTDPVIVASGQTYERVFIRKWLDLGLTVCPKTRQTLGHTNLIPNYTVKALIANWCELNNVKLPDPLKAMSSDQPLPLLAHADSSKLLGNHTMSPESVRAMGSPVKVVPRESNPPLHPRSPSDSTLPRMVGNGQTIKIGRSSLDSSTNLEDTTDLDGQTSISPPRKESSNADGNLSQGASSDMNGSDSLASNHLRGYSSDPSREMKPEAASNLSTPRREAEFPSRLTETRPRNHTFWMRPSEGFVPRITPSSATEARPDLSGIETQVRKLVEDLQSGSTETQQEATAELRLIAKHNMDNRIVIANCGAINLLVGLLYCMDMKIQENAVTALLNLSINDNNKVAIANADAIDPLIHVLKTGSPEAKENSAATLFSLSVIEDNKMKIGRSGAIGPLVDLLGNGTPRGKRDAATALFNLSIFHENKARIVKEGAVKHLVDLMDPAAGMVDKAVAVLANLATIPEGRTAIGQVGGIPVLVEVVELGSARGKENAAAALLHLCTSSSRHCSMVLQEGAVPPLVALSQSGTPRAKEKAQALLSYFRNQRHGNTGRG